MRRILLFFLIVLALILPVGCNSPTVDDGTKAGHARDVAAGGGKKAAMDKMAVSMRLASDLYMADRMEPFNAPKRVKAKVEQKVAKPSKVVAFAAPIKLSEGGWLS